MQNHLLIDPANPGLLYQLFYVLSFTAAYGVIAYQGYKRNFPLLSWLLLLAGIRLSVVIGTRIFSYSFDEWVYMLQNHVLLADHRKTMFGGILLGIIMFLIFRKILKFRYSAWDTVAYVLPFAVAIQTIGCFFYGCCFGTPSSLPWAVQYPVMTLPHYHQFESGLIGHNDFQSVPVHPVQLYNMVAAAVALFLTYKFRNRWKNNGSLLISSAIFFAITRFVTEFFRDPLSNKTGGEIIWFMKQVQWTYLLFSVIMIFLLYYNEKKRKTVTAKKPAELPGLNLSFFFLLGLTVILLLMRHWLTLWEIIAINIALIPAVVVSGIEIYKAFSELRFRWAYAFSLILPVFLMSQTIPQSPEDSTKVKTKNIEKYYGGGFSTGNYTDDKITFQGSGCDQITQQDYFSQKYFMTSASYDYLTVSDDQRKKLLFSGNIFGGGYSQIKRSTGERKEFVVAGIGGKVIYDLRWFGIGAGINTGNIQITTGDNDKDTPKPPAGSIWSPVFPSFYFRFGPKRFLYTDFHIADQFPVSFPGMTYQVGVGTGLGLRNGFNMRFGTFFQDDNSMYLSAVIPINKTLIIEPLYQWTQKTQYDETFGSPEQQFSLGLKYRFK